MQLMGSLKVVPELPAEISRLKELCYNLYFSWTPEARQLYRLINPALWTATNHNPVKFLLEVQQSDLERCVKDPMYLSNYKKVMTGFDAYMKTDDTWFSKSFPKEKDHPIAYFSAEFGFHESLPIYSGGLGVLAGDHLKSASDLGLPLVGVSLFYHQTYFTQQIDGHGNQLALYIPSDAEYMPLTAMTNSKGERIKVQVMVGHRAVKLQIWRAQVGRIPAYLLDANIPENSHEDRLLTARLYGGDQEMRISQEIILGMGGVLALQAMGIAPKAWHMNEGHSVFLALERIRQLMKRDKLDFYTAKEVVASNTMFTTHTPVPAGNDAFPLHFMDKYFQNYWESIGIRRYQFMELGSQVQPEGYEIFNLTILSLKLSKFRNGVSKLHGEVSRNMWKDVWPNLPTEEIPIKHITNGVHTKTWTVYAMRELFSTYLGENWEDHFDDPGYWKGVFTIPDGELWRTKLVVKQKMLNHLRERFENQVRRNKIGTLRLERLKDMLKADVLTIGFARRFATYKRGTLIFRNKERLKRILNNPERPVQLIFSGKAHPKDQGGQDLIRQINNIAMEEGFRGRVFFVENYDMSLARDLVSGVDVWLNNPRRPQEASGTSGQKVGMNGGINFSVMDGWWVEGYNAKNGFAFGDREDYTSLDELDSWDSDAIYDILENDLAPMYYGKDKDGIPTEWIQMMKHSIYTVSSQFNTQRMVKDYTNQMYLPALNNGRVFRGDNFAQAHDYIKWREHL
nr:alpha-glucan family phosphorylase [Calditrichia bacterium]